MAILKEKELREKDELLKRARESNAAFLHPVPEINSETPGSPKKRLKDQKEDISPKIERWIIPFESTPPPSSPVLKEDEDEAESNDYEAANLLVHLMSSSSLLNNKKN